MICLNMIVKDESRVIRRCLDSVKGIIDYWVIIDTGSMDGTQSIIQEHMKDIPGVLYERPWKNFGDNRTEAFELTKGKGDYVLFMDADDMLVFEEGFQFPPLTKDVYSLWRGTREASYLKPQLARAILPWKWIGVTHEYLDAEVSYTSDILQGIRYVSGEGSARSRDPNKYLKNVQLLEEALKKEPDNSRYVFYLAESYRDAGEKGKALEWYQKRVNMGGWPEEVFWALLHIGHMLRDMQLSPALIIEAYLQAYRFRPHRVEPVYSLVEILINQGRYKEGYECLKERERIPPPPQKDIIFNLDWIEQYGLLFELTVCAYYIGNYQESLDICDQLLAMKNLPQQWREQAIKNRNFALAKLN